MARRAQGEGGSFFHAGSPHLQQEGGSYELASTLPEHGIRIGRAEKGSACACLCRRSGRPARALDFPIVFDRSDRISLPLRLSALIEESFTSIDMNLKMSTKRATE
jgi:hypothetical protein